jgi:hypothetical protein
VLLVQVLQLVMVVSVLFGLQVDQLIMLAAVVVVPLELVERLVLAALAVVLTEQILV